MPGTVYLDSGVKRISPALLEVAVWWIKYRILCGHEYKLLHSEPSLQ